MSYQTTPIITRIKYNQGWFQEYFPQTTLMYRESVSFFNKNYSYMIFFFLKKKINLLKHEMIFDNKFVIVSYFTVQVELIKHFSSRTRAIKKLSQFTYKKAIQIGKYLSYLSKYKKLRFLRKLFNNKKKHVRFSFFFKKSILKNVSLRFLSIKKYNVLNPQKSHFFSYCTTNNKNKSFLFCCLKKSSFLQETDFSNKKILKKNSLYKNKKKSLLEKKYVLYKVKKQKKHLLFNYIKKNLIRLLYYVRTFLSKKKRVNLY